MFCGGWGSLVDVLCKDGGFVLNVIFSLGFCVIVCVVCDNVVLKGWFWFWLFMLRCLVCFFLNWCVVYGLFWF